MKPRVYISSSIELLEQAGELATSLQDIAETIVWTKRTPSPSSATATRLQALLEAVQTIDLAIFLLPDTPTGSHGLYFEAGLIAGAIGLSRTLFLARSAYPRASIPSLLAGMDFLIYTKTNKGAIRLIRDYVHNASSTPQSASRGPAGSVHSPRRIKPSRAASRARDHVFISYSHADQRWFESLKIALTPLVRYNELVVWDDSKIKPGENWRLEISRAVESAKVAVLLVSPHFLASPFIADNELPPLLDAAVADEATIIWVLLSACHYKKTPIVNFQAAHDISRPLDALIPSKRNAMWVQITEAIDEAFKL